MFMQNLGAAISRSTREDDLVVYYGYDDVDRLTEKVLEPQMNTDGHR
jgi:uncharacterized lipoprotein YajG